MFNDFCFIDFQKDLVPFIINFPYNNRPVRSVRLWAISTNTIHSHSFLVDLEKFRFLCILYRRITCCQDVNQFIETIKKDRENTTRIKMEQKFQNLDFVLILFPYLCCLMIIRRA